MTLYKFYKKSNPSVAVAKIVFNHLFSNYPVKKIEEVADSTSGGTPSRGISEYYGGDIPWIKSGELNDSHITNCEEYITELGLNNSSAKLYPKGTLVLALYGATVGKTGILDFEAASNQAVCAIYPYIEIDKDYMFWFFKQKRQEFIESSFGGAQPNISQKVVKETDIPVPSLEIQKEVVAFLDQCEHEGQIDKQFPFNEVIEQIEKYFNIRSCCEEIEISMKMTESLILSLRQSILQEAVQGKLVPQDPNDEPASVLLEKISANTKTDDNIKSVEFDSIETPEGWTIVNINQLLSSKNGMRTGPFGTMLSKSDQITTGVPVWGIESVSKNGEFAYNNKIFISNEKAKELESFYVEAGDIIISRSGTVGELCVLPHDVQKGIISTNLMKISLNKNIINPYFFCYLFRGSKLVLDKLNDLCSGSTRLFLTQKILNSLIFPIPPINEQKRIVEKVDQLMALCDELEQTVDQSKQESEMLMKSVLQEAFNSTDTNDNVIEFPSIISNDIKDWEIAARSEGEIDSETKAKIKNRVNDLLEKSRQ